MKKGSSLQELARTLEHQQVSKRDFVAPTSELVLNVLPLEKDAPAGRLARTSLKVNGHGEFDVTDLANEQIAGRVGIPQKYYDRMRANAPELLAANVNHWFTHEKESRMVRTLDGRTRAFMSARYRPLDNLDLAQATLPTLAEMGVTVESAELTERRLYIKAVTPKVTAEIKKGDMVQAGIVISNSEVGLGSVKVEPLIYRLVCLNGLIASDYSMKKYHVGRTGMEGDNAEEFFRDETRLADDKAFWLKVRDVVAGAFKRDLFERIVNTMRETTARTIDANPVQVVEVFRQRNALNESDGSGILTHLIKGGDLTQYGLLNAVTRYSQDVADYDRATELERLGGTVMDLNQSAWNSLLSEATKN